MVASQDTMLDVELVSTIYINIQEIKVMTAEFPKKLSGL